MEQFVSNNGTCYLEVDSRLRSRDPELQAMYEESCGKFCEIVFDSIAKATQWFVPYYARIIQLVPVAMDPDPDGVFTGPFHRIIVTINYRAGCAETFDKNLRYESVRWSESSSGSTVLSKETGGTNNMSGILLQSWRAKCGKRKYWFSSNQKITYEENTRRECL